MLDSRWLEQELRSCIADLHWLCDHLAQLSLDEVHRRLEESMAHQKKIVDHMGKHLHPLSEEHPLATELEAFRDGQRDLLLKIVQRLWFGGKVDCAKAIGREDVLAFILRCTAKRSGVRHEGALPGPRRN